MRKIFVLIVVLFHVNNMFSQSSSDRDLLYRRIEMRDSLIGGTHIKKKKILVDTLKTQLKDYQSLIRLLEIKQTELTEELEKTENERKYLQEEKESLTNKHFEIDDSPNVFTGKPFDTKNIPTCLMRYTTLVNYIIDIRKGIEKVERTIEQLKRENKNKKTIFEAIDEDVRKLDAMYNEYEEANKSPFSESQLLYIRKLTDRYNKFIDSYFQ